MAGCTAQQNQHAGHWLSEDDVIQGFTRIIRERDQALFRQHEIENNFPAHLADEPFSFEFTNFIVEAMPADYFPIPSDIETETYRILAQQGEFIWIRVIDTDDPNSECVTPIIIRDGRYYIYKPLYEEK